MFSLSNFELRRYQFKIDSQPTTSSSTFHTGEGSHIVRVTDSRGCSISLYVCLCYLFFLFRLYINPKMRHNLSFSLFFCNFLIWFIFRQFVAHIICLLPNLFFFNRQLSLPNCHFCFLLLHKMRATMTLPRAWSLWVLQVVNLLTNTKLGINTRTHPLSLPLPLSPLIFFVFVCCGTWFLLCPLFSKIKFSFFVIVFFFFFSVRLFEISFSLKNKRNGEYTVSEVSSPLAAGNCIFYII